MLAYELARRHYLIQRHLEAAPGTQAYSAVTELLSSLSYPHLYDLWNHDSETYQWIIPLLLLAQNQSQKILHTAPESLQNALTPLRENFLGTLLQEQERLIVDAQLYRYPYGRYLLLQHMHQWENWGASKSTGLPDRDLFRQYLGAYVQILQGLNPHHQLLEVWNQTAWLQRWQINDTARQDLPTQSSLRKQIEKYKLPERGKRLYAELDPGIQHQEEFVKNLRQQLPHYLEDWLKTPRFHQDLEQRVRELVQVSLRHAMKKGFRVSSISTALSTQLVKNSQPLSNDIQDWVYYTLIQELILGTQNLKYRLNDVLGGLAESPLPSRQALYHSILDGVMEIYESFSLAENALKSFVDQQEKFQGQQAHHTYTSLSARFQSE